VLSIMWEVSDFDSRVKCLSSHCSISFLHCHKQINKAPFCPLLQRFYYNEFTGLVRSECFSACTCDFFSCQFDFKQVYHDHWMKQGYCTLKGESGMHAYYFFVSTYEAFKMLVVNLFIRK